jgi:4a-hydroxytetrahydrobiopterin dehydratase
MARPMAARPLREAEIEQLLGTLPSWNVIEGRLQRRLRFTDFAEAFAFLTRVALIAERLNHHPQWSQAWNQVTITLITHDAGAITSLDAELAGRIEALVA